MSRLNSSNNTWFTKKKISKSSKLSTFFKAWIFAAVVWSSSVQAQDQKDVDKNNYESSTKTTFLDSSLSIPPAFQWNVEDFRDKIMWALDWVSTSDASSVQDAIYDLLNIPGGFTIGIRIIPDGTTVIREWNFINVIKVKIDQNWNVIIKDKISYEIVKNWKLKLLWNHKFTSKDAALVSAVEKRFKTQFWPFWAKVSVEEENYRLEWEFKVALDNIADSRVKGQLQLFFDAAKQYWAYVWYEKWKDVSNFSLATVIKIEWWHIKVSWAFLSKMMKFDFNEFNKSFDEKVKQSSFWVDFKKEFNNEIIRNATFSLIRYNTNNKDFWKLWDRITDNLSTYEWIEVYGWVRWATVTEAALSTTIRVNDIFKLSPKIWIGEFQYKDIWNSVGEKQANPTFWLEWVYQTLDNKTQLKWSINTSRFWKTAQAKFWHKFEWWVEWFVELGYTEWRNWLKWSTKAFVWVNIPLGWKKSSKYSPLYRDYKDAWKLTWSDLSVNPRVATEQFYVQKATWIDRIVYIDKTTLATWDSLDKNADGTLKSLLLDNGWFNITSINAINDTSYSSYIQVLAWQLAIVNFKWLNELMKSQWFQTWQIKNIRVSVNDTSWISIYDINLTKWSVEVRTLVERLHAVPIWLANDFINWLKTFLQVKDLVNVTDTPPTVWAPTTSNVTHNSLTVVNNITDVDWVQNVMYYIYSDAWWTNLISSNNTGNFSGLSANTTYYVRTTAETLKKDTNTWQLQTSSLVSVTTEALDTTPNTFTFIGVNNVTPSSIVESNEITVDGINSASPISISWHHTAMYSINGWAWTSVAWTVVNWDKVKLRITAGMYYSNYSPSRNATLTIWWVSSTFTITNIDGKPTGLSITWNTLSWDPVPWATKYMVQRIWDSWIEVWANTSYTWLVDWTRIVRATTAEIYRWIASDGINYGAVLPTPTLSTSNFYSNNWTLYYNSTNSPTITASSSWADYYEYRVNWGSWQNATSSTIEVNALAWLIEWASNTVNVRACNASNNCSSSNGISFVKDSVNKALDEVTGLSITEGENLNTLWYITISPAGVSGEDLAIISVTSTDFVIEWYTSSGNGRSILLNWNAWTPWVNKVVTVTTRDIAWNVKYTNIKITVNLDF